MIATISGLWTTFKAFKSIYQILAYIAIAASLYFAVGALVEKVKRNIAEPYVAAERVKVETEQTAKWEPPYIELTTKFDTQATQFNDLTQNVIDTRKAQEAEGEKALNKEKERAEQNEIKYRETLKKYQTAIAERDRLDVTVKQRDDSLRVITAKLATSDSDNSETRRLSRYTEDLGKRYESCERALTEANDDADAANDRASKCSAAVRALSAN